MGSQAILFNDDKKSVLLIKRCEFPVWTLPGGRRDGKELFPTTAERETFEEAGLKAKVLKYVGKYSVWYFPPAGVTHVYVCKKVRGKLIKGSEEVSEVKYWPIDRLPMNLLPYLRERIRDAVLLIS